MAGPLFLATYLLVLLVAGARGAVILCDCFQSCTSGSGPATTTFDLNVNFVTADYFTQTVTVLTDNEGMDYDRTTVVQPTQ